MEDEYRVYREMIAAGIGVLRPSTGVKTAGLDALERELARLDPQVVVCSRPETEEVEGRLVWVELPLDPIRPMKICRRGGRLSESVDPTLEALLTVVDEVGRQLQT